MAVFVNNTTQKIRMSNFMMIASVVLITLGLANVQAKNLPTPIMEFMTPVGRPQLSTSSNQQVCGGTKAGPVYFIAEPSSRNLIGWQVSQPSPTGNCTIRIGTSPKKGLMQTLYPMDNSGYQMSEHLVSDEQSQFQNALNVQSDDGWVQVDGMFPCGRSVTGFEAKEVKFPSNLECDSCVLELTWYTEQATLSYCADMTVSGATELSDCFGKCLNGGICINGKCQCDEGFSGSNCQYQQLGEGEEGIISQLFSSFMVLLLYAVMISLIVGLFGGAYIYWQKTKKVQLQQQQAQQAEQNGQMSGQQMQGDPGPSQLAINGPNVNM